MKVLFTQEKWPCRYKNEIPGLGPMSQSYWADKVAYQKNWLTYIALVTSQTFLQTVCILAGSLFYIA